MHLTDPPLSAQEPIVSNLSDLMDNDTTTGGAGLVA